MAVVLLFLLIDICSASVQDNFGRLHDRSKETPKTTKQLTRLFPNKVVIQLPQVGPIIPIQWNKTNGAKFL